MTGGVTFLAHPVDDLCFKLATTTDKPASMLPPTEDAFEQHVLRAKFQTNIWCQSHIAKPAAQDPVGNEWFWDDESGLQPTLFKQE